MEPNDESVGKWKISFMAELSQMIWSLHGARIPITKSETELTSAVETQGRSLNQTEHLVGTLNEPAPITGSILASFVVQQMDQANDLSQHCMERTVSAFVFTCVLI